jgi:hypothetical protein
MKRTGYIVLVVIASAWLFSVCGGRQRAAVDRPSSQSAAKVRNDAIPSELTYDQLFVGSDGETHFRQIRVPVISEATAPPAQPFSQSVLQPATSIRHAAFPPHWGVYDRDHGVFHNASSPRFINVRRGEVWIKASDGETRRFQAGDVLEVLDVAPSKGHITWTGDELTIVLFSNHP